MTAELSTIRTTRIRYRILVVVIAVVASIVVWAIAALAGTQAEVVSPLAGTVDITLPVVIGTALLAGLGAWGVLALLERRTPRARGIWTIAAVVILAVSLLSLLFLEATTASRVVLACMHLVVGVPLILLLRRGARNS